MAIRAKGITVTAVCSGCGSISEDDNGTFKLVKKAQGMMHIIPLIPLGTKGKLRGQVYQVIGFMRRYEKLYTDQPWDEYLLFNPYSGYCWLVENKGHWNLFKVTKSTPKQAFNGSIDFLGENFKVFHKGDAVVQFAVGEFYWKVRVGSSVKTMDAICPPHMVSQEIDSQETVWSLGEYLQPTEVIAAFNPQPLPKPEGVAPDQPASFRSVGEMWAFWSLVVLCLMFIQIIGHSFKAEKSITGLQVFAIPPGVTDTTIAKFTIGQSTAHVTIDLKSNISQTWATVGLRVVSDDPAKKIDHNFEKDLSFYSGYSDGEAWSEGSRDAEFLINDLPQGDYHVLLSAAPEAGHSVQIDSLVTVAPSVWANFWFALFLITLPPAWMAFRSRSFERNRWDDSEFNPFDKSGES